MAAPSSSIGEVQGSEEELRGEAVLRKLAGESPEAIARDLGRPSRWVRKWVTRHGQASSGEWAKDRSRASLASPKAAGGDLVEQILLARERLVANPRAQYGSLSVVPELRRLGVNPIPLPRAIERVLDRAGVSRSPRYVSKGVAYSSPPSSPGATHLIDLIGPRHLVCGVEVHALNLIDAVWHEAEKDIV